ncbi:hypothetical protein AB0L05_01215 [Nonomuraea pusilla]|uniref:hypothetical protein n=1 Tax=Nonomuraea pusilla TaxID=46177 RepID=UPI00332B816D
MHTTTITGLTAPNIFHDLVNDRIQTLHREAEEQRLAMRLSRVQRARREVERANARLRQALIRNH